MSAEVSGAPHLELGAAEAADIHAVINDAARAYRGVIPAACWHEPYMSRRELDAEIAAGVAFWLGRVDGRLAGVMGIQDRGEVMLIRHAYVRAPMQRRGVGSALLRHVHGLSDEPFLIGTWAAAVWAIAFYRRHGFTVIEAPDKDRLLARYWTVPAAQAAASVVLADNRWGRAGARTESC